MTAHLAQRYERYLDCLNDRRLEELDQHVQPELVYNDTPMTVGDYARLLADDVRTFPDLRYRADLLVAGTESIAARLLFDVTPAAPFRGIPPTGRRLMFAEHVFYRYRGDRIAQVWSLIDMDAIRAQSGAG